MVDIEKYEYADYILNPPDEYDKIKNKHGVCGKKPNLYYNDTVHRIYVTLIYKYIEECGHSVEECLEAYGKREWYEEGVPEPGEDPVADEMREAIEQSIEFYEEYEDEFESMRDHREKIWQQIRD